MGISPAFVAALTDKAFVSFVTWEERRRDAPFAAPCSRKLTPAVFVISLKKELNAAVLRD
jgi:hypothetical protein